MGKNTGIPYELLTQSIFNELVNQDSAKNIDVRHNVIVKGKTLEHQIDVYWEFEVSGIIYRTIIQAKDWNSSVSQEKLLAFKAILEDIPGQPRGIFVTKKGYQKGAKEYAKANGIIIYEFREPNEKDWKGRIKEIHFTFDVFFPHSKITQIIIDNDWAKGKISQEEYPNGLSFKIGGRPEDIDLLDSYGNVISNLKNETDKLFPEGLVEIPPTIKRVIFNQDYFVETGEIGLPLIKLLGFEVEYQVSNRKEEMVINYSDIVKYILMNVTTEEVKIFNKDMKLS